MLHLCNLSMLSRLGQSKILEPLEWRSLRVRSDLSWLMSRTLSKNVLLIIINCIVRLNLDAFQAFQDLQSCAGEAQSQFASRKHYCWWVVDNIKTGILHRGRDGLHSHSYYSVGEYLIEHSCKISKAIGYHQQFYVP